MGTFRLQTLYKVYISMYNAFHVVVHFLPPVRIYIYDICTYPLTTFQIHDKIAPVHECPHKNCSKGFHEKFDLSRHLKTHSAPRCDKCRKLLPGKDKKHICKPPDGEKDPDLKCTICGIYLDTKVKWGFHMWKHTKDPAYIQTRSTVIQKQLVNPLSEEPICLKSKHAANSNSVLQEVKS